MLKRNVYIVEVVGHSPFLMDRFSEASEKSLVDNKKPKVKTKKSELSIKETAELGVYRMNGTKSNIGIPSIMFRQAIINASKGIKLGKTAAKPIVAGGIQILPGKIDLGLKRPSGIDSRSIVNFQKGRVMKHRAYVFPWKAKFEIHTLETVPEDLLKVLIELAGQKCGIGSYAPRCSGNFGMFELVKFEKK